MPLPVECLTFVCSTKFSATYPFLCIVSHFCSLCKFFWNISISCIVSHSCSPSINLKGTSTSTYIVSHLCLLHNFFCNIYTSSKLGSLGLGWPSASQESNNSLSFLLYSWIPGSSNSWIQDSYFQPFSNSSLSILLWFLDPCILRSLDSRFSF